MSDSRSYAIKFIKNIRAKVSWGTRGGFLLFSALLAYAVVYFFSGESFSELQKYVLFILVLAIGLWVTEAIPPFAVGILVVGYLVFVTGKDNPENVHQYVQTWSDSVIWLVLGGFFLAEGLKKTNLDFALLNIVLPRLGNSFTNVLLGIMLLTALMSMIISNTATTAMMIAALSPILDKYKNNKDISKAFLVGVPLAASVGGMGTIIGSAPNAVAVGALEAIGIKVSFIEWFYFGFPVALFLVYFIWKILVKQYRIKELTLKFSITNLNQPVSSLDNNKRYIMIGILMFTLFLWVNSFWLNIPVAAVSIIPIVGTTFFMIVDADDVRQLPWDTLMLIAGGMALGLAVQQQGIAVHYIQQIDFAHIPYILVLIILAVMTSAFSNIMSNTATASIFLPIAVSITTLFFEVSPVLM
ncbi:MAG: DASS family sodium-coupled anion symporter, partial [Flavobacteriaceae bacterium]|nr:DASS family sodium-coupled anion symporter [Flavobacteriaceae bacterium]